MSQVAFTHLPRLVWKSTPQHDNNTQQTQCNTTHKACMKLSQGIRDGPTKFRRSKLKAWPSEVRDFAQYKGDIPTQTTTMGEQSCEKKGEILGEILRENVGEKFGEKFDEKNRCPRTPLFVAKRGSDFFHRKFHRVFHPPNFPCLHNAGAHSRPPRATAGSNPRASLGPISRP